MGTRRKQTPTMSRSPRRLQAHHTGAVDGADHAALRHNNHQRNAAEPSNQAKRQTPIKMGNHKQATATRKPVTSDSATHRPCPSRGPDQEITPTTNTLNTRQPRPPQTQQKKWKKGRPSVSSPDETANTGTAPGIQKALNQTGDETCLGATTPIRQGNGRTRRRAGGFHIQAGSQPGRMNECALLISIFNLSTLTAIPRRVPGTPMGLNFGLAGGSGGTGLCVCGRRRTAR